MATLYFIDTENLGGLWTSYVEKKYNQEPDCKILAFVTEKSTTLSWEMFEVFRKLSPKRFEICHAQNGEKNSLDFCLVARLGEEVAKNSKRNFVVVSKDKGFNAAIAYLNNRHGKIISRDEPLSALEILPEKILNSQRREKLAEICAVSTPMAEHLRMHLFAEKKDFSPYQNSLEYTVHWIQTSKAASFKSNPGLRKRLTDTLKKEYVQIMQL